MTKRAKPTNQQPVPPGRVVSTPAGDVTLPDRFFAVRVAMNTARADELVRRAPKAHARADVRRALRIAR